MRTRRARLTPHPLLDVPVLRFPYGPHPRIQNTESRHRLSDKPVRRYVIICCSSRDRLQNTPIPGSRVNHRFMDGISHLPNSFFLLCRRPTPLQIQPLRHVSNKSERQLLNQVRWASISPPNANGSIKRRKGDRFGVCPPSRNIVPATTTNTAQ